MMISRILKLGSVWAFALAFAVVAFPGQAQTINYYSLKVSNGAGVVGATAKLDFKNEETKGKANFVSLEFWIASPASGVTVEYVQVPNGNVIKISDTHYRIENLGPISNQQTYTVLVGLTGIACGATATPVTFDSDVWAGNSTSSNQFVETITTPVVAGSTITSDNSASITPNCDGEIQCGQAVPLVDTNGNNAFDPWEPGQAKSVRQLWNSNGASCELVPYDFTNAILSDGTVVLRWPTAPTASQRAAVFRTEATGKAKLLPATTDPYPTSTQVLYAWEFNLDGTPKWITPGLMCLDQEYPRPYATLDAPLAAGAVAGTQFSVTFIGTGPIVPGVEPPPPAQPTDPYYDPAGWKPLPLAGVPFELTIGNERIRVKVVSVSGTTATLEVVARAVWGTGPALSHAAGAFLLSVVMPADLRATTTVNGTANATNPYYQKVVRMCTISHGIRMYIPKPDNPDAQKSQYFEFVDYFDGDGWSRIQ